jgi:hypothetical protein
MDIQEEYPLLNEPNIMLIALKTARRGPVTPEDCVRELEANLTRAHEAPPEDGDLLLHRVTAAFRYLCVAGLLDPDETGSCAITERGRDVLMDNPTGVDPSVLMAFPEFRSYVARPNPFKRTADYETITEPSKEFDEGYVAHHAGLGLTDNPYEFDTFGHLEWENGWCDARDEPSDEG